MMRDTVMGLVRAAAGCEYRSRPAVHSLYCVLDQKRSRLAVPLGMPVSRLSVAALRRAFLTVAGEAAV